MLYRIIRTSVILISLLGCKGSPLSTKEPPDYAFGWNYIFWNLIVPEQKRQSSCAKSNSVKLCAGCKCESNKVTAGLILDTTTNSFIMEETLNPGHSFLCQCGSVFTSNSWHRSNTAEDSPQPGVELSDVFIVRKDMNQVNQAIIYKTHYNQPDNLYCFVQCPVGQYEQQYQFLKIR